MLTLYLIWCADALCLLLLLVCSHWPRDYSQDLDALLIGKPAKFAAEMLMMYQDYISKPLMQSNGAGPTSMESSAEVDEAEDM